MRELGHLRERRAKNAAFAKLKCATAGALLRCEAGQQANAAVNCALDPIGSMSPHPARAYAVQETRSGGCRGGLLRACRLLGAVMERRVALARTVISHMGWRGGNSTVAAARAHTVGTPIPISPS